jgi:hypothetical protein
MIREAEGTNSHLMPVYVSLDGLPSKASLRITGYWPTLVGSKTPGVAIFEERRCVVAGCQKGRVEADVGGTGN